jgi:VWFA-related protein
VLVLDDAGFPVSGLSRDDFELREDGEVQRLETFQMVEKQAAAIRPAIGPAPRPGERDEAAPSPAQPPRRFVLVLNRLNARTEFLVKAKRALEKIVRESLADGDEVMVVDLGESANVVQQLTPSRQQALQSIQRKLQTLAPRTSDFAEFGIGGGPDEHALQRRQSRNVYEALESLAQGLRRANGRKIVLLLSPDIARAKDFGPELRGVVSALNRANATLYAVDIASGTLAAAEGTGFRGVAGEGLTGSNPAETDPEVNALHAMAADTGGHYFTNLNAFDEALGQVVNENRIYYLLGYSPSNTLADGRFRRIEVKLKRPGMRVIARKGYLAEPARRR